MKILEWQDFFAQQRLSHEKVVFSVAELANAARTTLHTVNTELGRLVKRGVIKRYAQGWYGPCQGVAPRDVVEAVDPGAYITGLYALLQHHLVTQVPAQITCFTNRRHNRKAGRPNAAGNLNFIHVAAVIYCRPGHSPLAPPEQALCDYVWLTLGDALTPESLVTFRNLHRLNTRRLKKTLQRYPEAVQGAVARITQAVWLKARQSP